MKRLRVIATNDRTEFKRFFVFASSGWEVILLVVVWEIAGALALSYKTTKPRARMNLDLD